MCLSEWTGFFLPGLEDMHLGGYAKDPAHVENGIQTMIVPTIEEVIQLLIGRQAGSHVCILIFMGWCEHVLIG